MWLLGSTTKADLQGISEYFQQPLKVALLGGSGAGEATSVIKGGGTDRSVPKASKSKAAALTGRKIEDIESAVEELARRDKQALKELKAKIEGVIAASPVLSQFRNQLLIDITTEGLRIQIVDEQNRPMFAIGSAEPQPYTRDIGKVLSDVPKASLTVLPTCGASTSRCAAWEGTSSPCFGGPCNMHWRNCGCAKTA